MYVEEGISSFEEGIIYFYFDMIMIFRNFWGLLDGFIDDFLFFIIIVFIRDFFKKDKWFVGFLENI